MSARQMQRYTSASTKTFSGSSADGLVERFAATAASGRCLQNAERDLTRIAAKGFRFGLYYIQLPLKIRKVTKDKRVNVDMETIWRQIPTILPWRIMRAALETIFAP